MVLPKITIISYYKKFKNQYSQIFSSETKATNSPIFSVLKHKNERHFDGGSSNIRFKLIRYSQKFYWEVATDHRSKSIPIDLRKYNFCLLVNLINIKQDYPISQTAEYLNKSRVA